VAERLELERTEECEQCGYALCICPMLRHKKSCVRRKYVLCEGVPPTECTKHRVYACANCWPCTCGAPK
jgi:hypothetical protein